MKKIFKKKLLACVLTVSIVLASIVVSPESMKVSAATDTWTLAMYLCGSDLESGWGAATSDLLEMLDVREMPESVNVIIETGGSPKWFFKEAAEEYYKDIGLPKDYIDSNVNIPDISSDYLQRYRIQYNNEYRDEASGKAITYATLELLDDKVALNNIELAKENESTSNMGDENCLEEFLNYTQTEFPAENNMVTLWNHGGGTVSGVCYDYYSEDMLSLAEMKKVFDVMSPSLPNNKYDLISFDACLMATYETLVTLTSSAEYMVGALTSEPGDGQEYTGYLKELAQNAENLSFTGKELGNAVVKAFKEYYCEDGAKVTAVGKEQIGEYEKEAMLANFDLSRISDSLSVFDKMAETLLYLERDEEGMSAMLQEIYDTSGVEEQNDLVSMKSFLEKTLDFAAKRATVLEKSSLVQENSLGKKYEKYVELAQRMYDILFDGQSGAVLSEYSGWEEENSHYSQGAISLYLPTPQTSAGVKFLDKTYSLLEISENYAIFAYHLGNANQNEQCKEPEQKLIWDAESGSYAYTVQEDLYPFLNSMGVQSFLKRQDGKYYYLAEDSVSPSSDGYELVPKGQYFSFNGVPLGVYQYGSGIYGMLCLYNGQIGEMYYIVQEDDSVLFAGIEFDADIGGDEVEELEKGDVIVPVATVADSAGYLDSNAQMNSLVSEETAAFTVSQKNKTNMLPIKKETADTANLEYVFFVKTKNKAQKYKQTVVNHKDILDFSNAKVVLEKEAYEMTGKEIKPKVTVSYGNKVYEEGKDYTVTYGNNIGTGTGIVTITGLGQYSCVPEVSKAFLISEPKAQVVEKKVVEKQVVTKTVIVYRSVPTAVKINTAKKRKKSIVVKYKKKAGKNIGYQIAYATKQNGKKKVVGSTTKTSFTIKKIKKNKKYYVYVRAYIKQNGKKTLGAWSKAKTVK